MWRRQEGNHSDLFEVGEAQVNYFLINGFEPQLCITVYLIFVGGSSQVIP